MNDELVVALAKIVLFFQRQELYPDDKNLLHDWVRMCGSAMYIVDRAELKNEESQWK